MIQRHGLLASSQTQISLVANKPRRECHLSSLTIYSTLHKQQSDLDERDLRPGVALVALAHERELQSRLHGAGAQQLPRLPVQRHRSHQPHLQAVFAGFASQADTSVGS